MKPGAVMGLLKKITSDPYKAEPRVIDTSGAVLRLERGDRASLESDRVAVVSSWAPTNAMSRSFSEYLRQLDDCGYTPFVVSTTESEGPLEWPYGLPASAVVVRRDNIGYDFGSYAAALNAVPFLRDIDHLLLTNDSLVGPFAPIDDIIRTAESSSADMCSLTESQQYVHHPQSFFLMFRRGVLNEKPMRRFFDEVRQQSEKVGVIQAYELGLSRFCAHEGYSWESVVGAYRTAVGGENPTLYAWEPILDFGVPFVKRNILLDETRTKLTRGMPTAIWNRYGQDVRAWLPDGCELPEELEIEARKVTS